MRDRILMLTLSTTVLACGEEPLEGDMLAIGDSILEWNAEEGASIPDAIGAELGVSMANASVSGSQVLGGEAAIPDQYQAGGWSWVVMDGGGNDLNDRCGCGECDEVMDALISADGTTGAIPELVEAARADGARVAWVGYYDVPEGAEHGFDRCGDDLTEMRARGQAMAEADAGVLYVDAAEAFGADELDMYDEDRVHPSVAGSAAVGALVAEKIRAAGE